MHGLHFLRAPYDNFVYDFPYDISDIVEATGYDVCVYITYDDRTIFVLFIQEQYLSHLNVTARPPYGRRTAVVRLPWGESAISTDIARAPCGNRTMAVRVTNKSTISVRFF